MGPGKQTVFLLSEKPGDLVKTAKLEFIHLGLSKLAVFTRASSGLVLAAGCMGE